jgi:hypothetical protein
MTYGADSAGVYSDGNQGGTTNLKTTHLDLQTLRILGKSEDDRRVSSIMASFGRQWE